MVHKILFKIITSWFTQALKRFNETIKLLKETFGELIADLTSIMPLGGNLFERAKT